MKNPRFHTLLSLRTVPTSVSQISRDNFISRSHLTDTLNGLRPVYDGPAESKPASQPMSTTWKKLKHILTSEEFMCAFQFANAERQRLGFPILTDDPKIQSRMEEVEPAKM